MNRFTRSSLKFNNTVRVIPFSQFRPIKPTSEKRTLKSPLKPILKTPIKPIKPQSIKNPFKNNQTKNLLCPYQRTRSNF